MSTSPQYIYENTVKPVLRGHDLWDIEKCLFKTDNLLKHVPLILNFLGQDKENVTF